MRSVRGWGTDSICRTGPVRLPRTRLTSTSGTRRRRGHASRRTGQRCADPCCCESRCSGSRRTTYGHAAPSPSRVTREQMLWSNPLADLLMAGVHATRGQDARAIRRLIRALTRFETTHLGAYAAAARRRYGQLLGGAAGASLVAAAEQWMRAAEVANPTRMTAVLAPGFED